MKKAVRSIASDKASAPKAVRSISADKFHEDAREDEPGTMTQVDRLNAIVNGPISAAPDNRDWDYSISNVGQGTREIEAQLEVFRQEIHVLEHVLRPHLPDYLYDEKDDGEGVAYEGYHPAGNGSHTPAVAALCEVANTIQRLRRQLGFITSHVVV